ncbi:MAG: hypothetical protein NTV31_05450 [Bacteroidia bacterium]|nr:hypothetical protein [Bacteroidia bacterium]
MKARIIITCWLTALLQMVILQSNGQNNTINDSAGRAVYLHTDRSFYLSGESILFKAYLLDDLNNRSHPVNDTLYVALLDQDGLEVASGKFPANNDQIRGNIELPDFLTEGNYILIASTRLTYNLAPEKMFSRVIEIRKSVESGFYTDLSLTDTLYESGSLLNAQIKFSGKGNKPVPVNFTYQLTVISGEILSGISKSNIDGMATLELQLPEFDNKEIMKLLVVSSYKGKKNTTGLVIPTQYNYTGGKIQPERNLSANEFRNLKILLKTDKPQYEQKEKVQLDIYVTDDKGIPVMANLSVSASNIIPHQLPFENDNIVTYTNLKSNRSEFISNRSRVVSGMKETTSETEKIMPPDEPGMESLFNLQIRKFFSQYLLLITRSPGSQFIVQKKNNPEKLRREEVSLNQKKQNGYSSDRNIFDILMQIKPYRIENGKIIFGINTQNSINILDGALIIVDGIKMGTDAELLNSIPVPDIARITASTNTLDIQRYTAMNSVGIIEIFMKKNNDFVKNEETGTKIKNSTLFWGPDIITDSSGKASISFFNNNKSTEVLISVEGVATNGLYGSSSIRYSVK